MTTREHLRVHLLPYTIGYKPLLAMSDPDVVPTLRMSADLKLEDLLDMVEASYAEKIS